MKTSKSMKDTKEIRKELKQELGYNARQVSVKNDHYTSLHFTVRDASVNMEAVKEFASRYENVRRCEVTHEILSGGNTFIRVEATEEVKNKWAEKHIEEVSIALQIIKHGGEQYAELSNGHAIMFARHNDVNLISYNKEGFGTTLGTYWICEDSARAIAIKIAK